MSCDSVCSSPLLAGGAKKKRPLTPWMELVIKLKKENPDKKLMEILKMAKKVYKKDDAKSVKKVAKKPAKKVAKKPAKKVAKKAKKTSRK